MWLRNLISYRTMRLHEHEVPFRGRGFASGIEFAITHITLNRECAFCSTRCNATHSVEKEDPREITLMLRYQCCGHMSTGRRHSDLRSLYGHHGAVGLEPGTCANCSCSIK